jgi:hypothetical protein
MMMNDPLVEIDRLAMMNQTRPVRGRDRAQGGITTAANLIFITKLFDTQEAVEKLLEEIKETEGTEGSNSTNATGNEANADNSPSNATP